MTVKDILSDIKSSYETEEAEREKVILKSREIIALSKKIIYSLHRDDIPSAEEGLKLIEEEIFKLTEISKDTRQHNSGSYRVAFQEYVEALSYYKFIKDGNLVKPKEGMDNELYLLGICDLTGELVRRALNQGIEGNFQEIRKIKDFVSEVYENLLQFNFRNGELRKKVDSIRWDLKKLEELAFDLKSRDKI
jgi:predicted translin family RNA/ssDNA-binding protein